MNTSANDMTFLGYNKSGAAIHEDIWFERVPLPSLALCLIGQQNCRQCIYALAQCVRTFFVIRWLPKLCHDSKSRSTGSKKLPPHALPLLSFFDLSRAAGQLVQEAKAAAAAATEHVHVGWVFFFKWRQHILNIIDFFLLSMLTVIPDSTSSCRTEHSVLWPASNPSIPLSKLGRIIS